MEEESFEDEEIAKFLNEQFISVKVDRKNVRISTPSTWQPCRHLPTQGWPMSVWLTPEGNSLGWDLFPSSRRRPWSNDRFLLVLRHWLRPLGSPYRDSGASERLTSFLKQSSGGELYGTNSRVFIMKSSNFIETDLIQFMGATGGT